MSDYTITLKRCSEVYGEREIISWFKDYNELNYLNHEQYETIRDSNLWNKDLLANMIFEHYFMREIAYETPEMFRHFAKVKLQEIMRKLSSFNLFLLLGI